MLKLYLICYHKIHLWSCPPSHNFCTYSTLVFSQHYQYKGIQHWDLIIPAAVASNLASISCMAQDSHTSVTWDSVQLHLSSFLQARVNTPAGPEAQLDPVMSTRLRLRCVWCWMPHFTSTTLFRAWSMHQPLELENPISSSGYCFAIKTESWREKSLLANRWKSMQSSLSLEYRGICFAFSSLPALQMALFDNTHVLCRICCVMRATTPHSLMVLSQFTLVIT